MTGPELRERRIALGMDEKELAEALGVTEAHINEWEIDWGAPAQILGPCSRVLELAMDSLETSAYLASDEIQETHRRVEEALAGTGF